LCSDCSENYCPRPSGPRTTSLFPAAESHLRDFGGGPRYARASAPRGGRSCHDYGLAPKKSGFTSPRGNRIQRPRDSHAGAARPLDRSNYDDRFAADLTPAGYHVTMLVGASPEVLVKKRGNVVSAHPLAGSAARSANPEEDRLAGERLLASDKDLREHAFVVEHLTEILAPMCDTFYAPNTPQLVQTNEMWHLRTPITGTLKKPTTALELAVRCHPTPAICGT